jgi:hypothetical protein
MMLTATALPAKKRVVTAASAGEIGTAAQRGTCLGVHKGGPSLKLNYHFIKRLAAKVNPAQVKSMAMRSFHQEEFSDHLKEFSSIAAGMDFQTSHFMSELQNDFRKPLQPEKKTYFDAFKKWANLHYILFDSESDSEAESEIPINTQSRCAPVQSRKAGRMAAALVEAEHAFRSDSDHELDAGINSNTKRWPCVADRVELVDEEITLAACGRFFWSMDASTGSMMLGGQGIETHLINLTTTSDSNVCFQLVQLCPYVTQLDPESIEIDARVGYRVNSRCAFKLVPVSEEGDVMYLMWARNEKDAGLFVERLQNRYSAIPPKIDRTKGSLVGIKGYSNKKLDTEFIREVLEHKAHPGDCEMDTCETAATYQFCGRGCKFKGFTCSNGLQHLEGVVQKNIAKLELRASIFQRSQVALYVKEGNTVEGCFGMYQGSVYDGNKTSEPHSCYSVKLRPLLRSTKCFYVDAEEHGNHTKFLQHRSEDTANCYMEEYILPSGHPVVLLFTKEKIGGAGQGPVELSFNYGNMYNTKDFHKGPTQLALSKSERDDLHALYWYTTSLGSRGQSIAPQGHSMICMSCKHAKAEADWVEKLCKKAQHLQHKLRAAYWVLSDAKAMAGTRAPFQNEINCEVITYSLPWAGQEVQGPLIPTYGTVAMLEAIQEQGGPGTRHYMDQLQAKNFETTNGAYLMGSSHSGTLPTWHPGKIPLHMLPLVARSCPVLWHVPPNSDNLHVVHGSN